MRLPLRLAALAGLGALAVGLAACTSDEEPDSPEDDTTSAADEETETGDNADEQEEDGLQAIAGVWEEDVEQLGGTLTVEADGYVLWEAEGGPMDGTLEAAEDGGFEVELVAAEGHPGYGQDDGLAQTWVLTYIAESDALHAERTWSDGSVHPADFLRA